MKKNTCFVMLAALMLAGCSNEVEEQVMDSRRVPLQINGDINMLMTRAADNHWDKDDAIGVYMVNAENGIVGDVSNYRYVVIDKDNGNFSPDGENNTAYFPEDGTVNVVAYYPHGDVVDDKLSLDLSDQSEQPRIDLMSARAEGASKNNPAINLKFNHRLTKLFFEFEIVGDVNTDGISAAISDQYTDIQYDILNDKLSIAGGDTKKNIVMKYWNLDNYRFTEAIVLPNDENNSAVERKLTFQLNEKTFNAKIGSETKFEAGKKYIYKVKFEQTPSGNLNVSITGVSIKNWDNINSEGNTIIPGTLKFDKLYLASGFTSWSEPYEMTKSEDGKIFTWTGNVQNDNQEMKFALLQQSLSGDVQLMPNMNGANNKDVVLGAEMDAYPVIYYYKENDPIKRDNKWVIKEKGTYTVTVNVETMKVKVEKLDVVYLVGTVLVPEGGNPDDGYELKKAPYFTKNSEGKYELTINFLNEGEFKILSKIEYDRTNTNYDYYAPGDKTPFEPGNSMTVDYRQANGKDYKWKVAADQTGTYKLTLDTSAMTLTAEKLENQQ